MANPLGDALRSTMRRWAAGVSVVTSRDGDRRAGMTVTAFFSVSLDPPVVLVSLHEGADTLDLLRRSKAFAVSILGEGHEDAAARFAGPSGTDRFSGSPVRAETTGAPILEGAIGWLDCRLRATHAEGTHALVLGDVVAAGVAPASARPLLYFDRAYRRLPPT